MTLSIIVMAAGKGTRMKSELPKVLHPIAGRPMIHFVIDTALSLNPSKIVIIVGHLAESVKESIQQEFQSVVLNYALQSPQLGTGHAVMQAQKPLEGLEGNVIVLSGDVPLTAAETLQSLLDYHIAEKAAATVLTARLADPTGYGRIIRSDDGSRVLRIIEQKDCTPEENLVNEINSGIYVFDKKELFLALGRVSNHNAQKEYYLTDVLGLLSDSKKKICAVEAQNFNEIRGINTPEQLKEAEDILLA
ncbi:MAG: sugar phosphate nucleotidyltransferase [Chloroherpetonaceae bacterium]|nr:sugar phosphate nucleotidyltransferase [Chloroherpetonaceae bacterium]